MKILLFLAAITTLAYFVQSFLKSKINPRKSFGHLILFLLANLLSVLVLTFLFTFVLLKFKTLLF